MTDPLVLPIRLSRRQRRLLRNKQRADRRKFDGELYSAWTPVGPPPAARLDPPGELALADELVPSEPLAATLYLDGARQTAIPELVRAAHGDLTLASVRAAVASLGPAPDHARATARRAAAQVRRWTRRQAARASAAATLVTWTW